MSELRTELVAVGGRQTAVVTAGTGGPVVFLHGGGIVEGFECFLPLAERFRFVAPQMPGFDRTDLRPPITGIDELVEHTALLLTALGIDSFTLVGHSLGGWVAASLAAAHPARVRALAIAAPYGLDVPEHPIANTRAMSREQLYGSLTRDASIWEGRLPSGEDPEFDAARAREGQSLAGFVPGPFDPALERRLATLAMPLLLLWGDDDQIVPVGHLGAWRAALPAAEVRVYPGVGHLLFHEEPAAVEAIAELAGIG